MENASSIVNFFSTLLALVPFYLIGAYPTGYLIAKRRGVDIANSGSGNIGATNIGRFLGIRAGVWTLLGDIMKGFLPMLLALKLFGHSFFPALCGIALVSGHCFSIPKILPGGKGVSTYFGVILALQPYIALMALPVFIIVLISFRMVSVASMTSVFLTPIFAMLLAASEYETLAMAIISAIIVYRHKSNIKRIILGVERKIYSEIQKY